MTKSKNRKLADLISTGSAFADGSVAASEVTGLGTAATAASTDFATASQGTLAASALQPSGDGSGLSGISSLNNLGTDMLTSSQTWVAPLTGTVVIQCVGGGGSGAYLNYGGNGSTNLATGGGSGGFSSQKLNITAGDQLVVSIGSGGAGSGAQTMRDPAGGGYPSFVRGNGNAGGNSTCQGSNIGSGNVTVNMAANGGGGGFYSHTDAVDFTLTVNPSTGGTASGGTVNKTGGAGGAVIAQQGGTAYYLSGYGHPTWGGNVGGSGGVIASLYPTASANTAQSSAYSIYASNNQATNTIEAGLGRAGPISYVSSFTPRAGRGWAAQGSTTNGVEVIGDYGTFGCGGGGVSHMKYSTGSNRQASVETLQGGDGFVAITFFAAV